MPNISCVLIRVAIRDWCASLKVVSVINNFFCFKTSRATSFGPLSSRICLKVFGTIFFAFGDFAIPKSDSFAGVVSLNFGRFRTSELPFTITSAKKLRAFEALSLLLEKLNKLFSLSINFV